MNYVTFYNKLLALALLELSETEPTHEQIIQGLESRLSIGREHTKALFSLRDAVDNLLADAGYDTLFDTREKGLETLRQDIKVKLGTATVDRETLARMMFDESYESGSAFWHELGALTQARWLRAADIALRLLQPAPTSEASEIAAKAREANAILGRIMHTLRGVVAFPGVEHTPDPELPPDVKDTLAQVLKLVRPVPSNDEVAQNTVAQEIFHALGEPAERRLPVTVGLAIALCRVAKLAESYDKLAVENGELKRKLEAPPLETTIHDEVAEQIRLAMSGWTLTRWVSPMLGLALAGVTDYGKRLRGETPPATPPADIDMEAFAKVLFECDPDGPTQNWETFEKAPKFMQNAWRAAAKTARDHLKVDVLRAESVRLREEREAAVSKLQIALSERDTQEQMRLDLAAEQDKLVAALNEAQDLCGKANRDYLRVHHEAYQELQRHTATRQDLKTWQATAEEMGGRLEAEQKELAAERKKWPELKAEVDRLKKLVRSHELTMSLLGKIIRGADPNTVLRDAETGELARLAPDVRQALGELIRRVRTAEEARADQEQVIQKLRVTLQSYVLTGFGKPATHHLEPLDRDRIRLALLDAPVGSVALSMLNPLADHLVEKLK